MKKIFFVFIFSVFMGVFSTNAQYQNNYISVSGIIMNIPHPDKEFMEVGVDNHIVFKDFVPEDNILQLMFIDNNSYIKLNNNDTFSLSAKRYMIIEDNISIDSTTYNKDEFSELRDLVIGKNIINQKQIEDSIISAIKFAKNNIATIENMEPITLGGIYSSENAIGSLMLTFTIEDSKVLTKLVSVSYLRIKEKLIYAYIFTSYYDKQDINWITNLSESWAKAIIEVNK